MLDHEADTGHLNAQDGELEVHRVGAGRERSGVRDDRAGGRGGGALGAVALPAATTGVARLHAYRTA
jgi:hypothetical protein